MIFGLDLKAGDEVVMTTQNYPRMQNAWRQRERREGIVLKRIKVRRGGAWAWEPGRAQAWCPCPSGPPARCQPQGLLGRQRP